jgi:replicative DNA helicase
MTVKFMSDSSCVQEYLMQAQAPCSLEAEQAVIGALFLRPDAYDQIDWLPAADFYVERHRLIYHAIRSMLEAGEPVDVLLVADRLRRGADLERVGGMAYLDEIAVNTASAANIRRYAEIVKSTALLRRIQELAADLRERSHEPGAVASEIADTAEERLNDIRHGKDDSEEVPFHASLDAAMLARSRPDSGVHTGFVDLDRMIKPLRGGELIIIAGRPSMGKSGMAANIAEHVAKTLPVGAWSLEMSNASIAERVLSWHEKKDINAAGKLAELNLWIGTPHTLSVGSLRLRMKRLRRKHGLALAMVDYLGLMRGEGENRTQEIGSISRGLKGLAIEFGIPIIAVAQLNRGTEGRLDRRPLLSDLRESGDVEQDADIVLMLYRDDYYNNGSPAKGTAEVLVRKHRNGPTGMVRLAFLEQYARFENYAGRPIYESAPAAPKRRRTEPAKPRAYADA